MSTVPQYSDPLDEPLAETAAMARQWAMQDCPRDATGSSCTSYHGLWQYLRLMKLGKTLGGHAGQYFQAMAHVSGQWDEQPGTAPRRILISGCADYSMLAHVLHVFQRAGSPIQITVLDRCPTPLKLNGWYAQRAGTSVELVCSDILQHQPGDGYDLIVTSSFLGYFKPETRPGLFERYADMLRSGGRLIFSNRLRPDPETIQVEFTDAQSEAFATKVTQLSDHLPVTAPLSQADAYKTALAYAANLRTFPVNAAETIQHLAASVGLRWMSGSQVTGGAPQPEISGPTLADGSDYLFVVLEK